MFEVLSVENTDENCEFSSFALVFRSPCKFPFSFREDLVVVNKYNSIYLLQGNIASFSFL